MWRLVGKSRASYLVSLFKATQGQKENTACLKWQGQGKLSAGAPGYQYSHYKMAAEKNHKEIGVLFLQIISTLCQIGHGSVLSLFLRGFQVREVCLICFPIVDGLTLLGGSTWGDIEKTNSFYNFLLEKLERHGVLLSFVVVYAVLQGKFQAHPAGEGIMTGLLSSEEEEVRAESQQSQHLLTTLFESQNEWRTTSGVSFITRGN